MENKDIIKNIVAGAIFLLCFSFAWYLITHFEIIFWIWFFGSIGILFIMALFTIGSIFLDPNEDKLSVKERD